MKIKRVIVTLLLIVIVLISIDIISGIWFWNKYNLIFSSENFNNITTPILTFVAIVIYGLALFTSINQNRIIYDQSIQPHYLEEIKKLKKKAKKQNLDNLGVIKGEKVNLLNFTTHLFSTITNLTKNVEFLQDYNDYENGIEHGFLYFKEREYFKLLMFIYEFTIGFDIKFNFIDIKKLVQEINSSKLLENNKQILRKKIKKELCIEEYLAFIEFFDKNSGHIAPLLPMVFERFNIENDKKIIYKPITDTSLREPYDWYKKNFN
jgi:hypothetical protein